MSVRVLSEREIREKAPSLFTNEPNFNSVSNKYYFVNTLDVVREIQKFNWHVVQVDQSTVHDSSNDGYQTHLVKFVHLDDLLSNNENSVQLLLFNNHSGNKSMSISCGVYRACCANGMVCADSVFEEFKIRHIGDKEKDVAEAIAKITAIKPKIMADIKAMESITLNEEEKLSFAKSALPIRFEEHLEVNPIDLLKAHRVEDRKSDNLYVTLNIIQENMIRGNITGVNKDTNRKFTSKPILSLIKDKIINKGIWEVANRIKTIKEQSLLMAA